MQHEMTHLKKWGKSSHIDWWSMLPPGRPSREHLDFWSKELDALAPESALILGSTPELRDLCQAKKLKNITIIDASKPFHKHVSKQCVLVATNERVIFRPWELELVKHKGEFDIVIGDLVSGNVAFEDRLRFYEDIAAALTRGGRFIEKTLTNRPGYLKLNDLDIHYAKQSLNLGSVNSFANSYFFTSELVEMRKLVDVVWIARQLAHRFADRPILSRLLKESFRVIPRKGTWFYGRDWMELAAEYDAVFAVQSQFVESASDEFRDRLEIFSCEAR